MQYGVDFSKLKALNLEPTGFRPESTSYHSYNLEEIKGLLSKKVRPRILNLGPFEHGLFNFISQFNPLMVNLDPESRTLDECVSQIESHVEGFDLILLWDRLLYLSRLERNKLVSVLSTRSKEGTSLLAYSSVRKQVPAQPSKFQLALNSIVNVNPLTKETISTAGYDPRAELFGWKCRHSLQLRNSLREHLFVKI
jgi:hypothetical protein